ncbi:MAG TPA: endo-1,4-beta-xylanase, partial [Polyangiaceae bacterium]|nr:endo-1,4-beta-xylanase [Polyangiaceae bacterium]
MHKRILRTVGLSLSLGVFACSGSSGDDSGANGTSAGTANSAGNGGSTQTGGSSGIISNGGSIATAGSGTLPTAGSSSAGASSGGSGTSGTSSGGTAGSPSAGMAGSGTAGSGGDASTQKFVGNITTQDQVDTNNLTYSKYWDEITPENAGKWGSVQATATSPFNWATLDAIYDYTQKNNVV